MLRKEIIGVPECPLIHRWTLLGEPTWPGTWPIKLMVHYFLPTSRNRDYHDHPRSFITIVVKGYYDDIRPDGTTERMKAPKIKFREAKHAHTTIAGPKGAWTIVIMGPKRRPWGFIREGRWWPWKKYEEKFGHDFRCEED